MPLLVFSQRSRIKNKSKITPICTLELKNAPVIRGLRLGMSKLEFLKLFPSATELENSRPEVGAISYEVNQEENPNFADKSVILNFVWFVDDKLSSLGFKYPDYEPISINDFVRQAATKLDLPLNGWGNYDGLSNPKILKCKEFDVMIGWEMFRAGVGDPYLILSDYEGDKKITEREKENKKKEEDEHRRKEREKRTFKPKQIEFLNQF